MIGFQDLNYTIFDLDTYEVVQHGAVPLTKGATLSWIGFSEEQVPYMYDSTGYLSALDRARRPMQGRWVPMLDTNTLARREGKQESYWPVGVHDASLMCVILKVSRYNAYKMTKPAHTDCTHREERSIHSSQLQSLWILTSKCHS